jgi:hypothetical protein
MRITTPSHGDRIAVRIVSGFFLSDVAFTFLPVGVNAVLQLSFGKFTPSFFIGPEWSFASIIVFGLALTRILELKVTYQRDRSANVFFLAKICILGLIAAVIGLALVQMKGAGIAVSTHCILWIQFSVLNSGLLLLFMAHVAKEQFIESRDQLPQGTGPLRYLRFIIDDLRSTRTKIDQLTRRIAQRDLFTFSGAAEEAELGAQISRQTRDVDHLISGLKLSMATLECARRDWGRPVIVPAVKVYSSDGKTDEVR